MKPSSKRRSKLIMGQNVLDLLKKMSSRGWILSSLISRHLRVDATCRPYFFPSYGALYLHSYLKKKKRSLHSKKKRKRKKRQKALYGEECNEEFMEEESEGDEEESSKPVFQSKWLKTWEWMRYDRDLDACFCTICESYAIRGNSPFAQGGSRNFKTSSFKGHAACKTHKTAAAKKLDAGKQKKPVVVAIQRMHEAVDGAVLNLFRAAYTLAVRSWSFNDFPHVIDLLEVSGCSSITKQLYHNDHACQEFICCIGESLNLSLLARVKASPFFGLQVDESTDVATQQHIVLCMSYLEYDSEPKRNFLGILRLKKADASSICSALEEHLKKAGLDMSKLVGFGSDGCSTMAGQKTGVATRLKAKCPFLTSIHCVAHRTNLALGDASKLEGMEWFGDMETLINSVAAHFSCSSKRLEYLQDLLKEYACDILRPERIHKTRWLSRHHAIAKLCEDLPAVLKYSQMESIGIFNKLDVFKTIYLLHYLADILGGLTILSKLFQANYVDITCVEEHILGVIEGIQTYYIADPKADMNAYAHDARGYIIIPDYGPPNGWLAALRCSIRGNEYREFMIVRDRDGLDLEDAIMLQKAFAQAICDSLTTRFQDASILGHFVIFSPTHFPRSSIGSREFGLESLEKIIKFYGMPKEVSGMQQQALIDGATLRREYTDYKIHATANWHHKTLEQVCAIIASSSFTSSRFKNILTLLQIALVQCASNAVCERVFSTRTSIKDRWRPNLDVESLNACLHIVINGPEHAKDFDFSESMEIWKAKANRHIYHGQPSQHLV